MNEVKPYTSQEGHKKEQVTQMFDGIAPYYDLLNRLLSLGIDTVWRKKAIKIVASHHPSTMLDVATGTADLAIEAHRQIPSLQVQGIDISSQMIAKGNEKLEKKQLTSSIRLEVGDSEALPYSTNTFDVVTAAFGVRNFGNLEKGLKEMHRVTQAKGQILILEFSRPRLFPFKQLFNAYFKYILPVIGRIKSKDPRAYSYLYESVQAFPDYENFGKILEKVGYKNVTWKPLSLGICTIYCGTKA